MTEKQKAALDALYSWWRVGRGGICATGQWQKCACYGCVMKRAAEEYCKEADGLPLTSTDLPSTEARQTVLVHNVCLSCVNVGVDDAEDPCKTCLASGSFTGLVEKRCGNCFYNDKQPDPCHDYSRTNLWKPRNG